MIRRALFLCLPLLISTLSAAPHHAGVIAPGTYRLSEFRARDACILPDPATRTYTMVFSAGQRGPHGRPAVVAFTSPDLEHWTGPKVVFEIPAGFWAQKAIWAPELHAYRGRYYLFLTFDTDERFPEQWRNWLPRVRRGSQVLVADSPLGPFRPFANHATLPADMMTLDGTLWEEDGHPWMVFAHEWVQIKDGTVEAIRLSDDLSRTTGEPRKLFDGSDATWSMKTADHGCHVTDGPWLHRFKSGKLVMLWSTFSPTGYTTGFAVSDSGRLGGPWRQAPAPLFTADGGHAMLFRRFDGQLMMALHQPNHPPDERIRLLEVEETDDSLRLKHPGDDAPVAGKP
jgi:beta-xylosidase